MLLLIVGTGATSILSTTHAQSATLGEPYFVEKGMLTTQKEIAPNKTQFTFAANGTMNGDIEVTTQESLKVFLKVNQPRTINNQAWDNNDQRWE